MSQFPKTWEEYVRGHVDPLGAKSRQDIVNQGAVEDECSKPLITKTLDEIKARVREDGGPIWSAIGRWWSTRDEVGTASDEDVGAIETSICAATDAAYEAGVGERASLRFRNAALQDQADKNAYRADALTLQLAEARDLLMRASITGGRIVFGYDGNYRLSVRAPQAPSDPFQPSQQPASPQPKDAFAAHGDAIGVDARNAAKSAEPVRDRSAHGIGRQWRGDGIGGGFGS